MSDPARLAAAPASARRRRLAMAAAAALAALGSGGCGFQLRGSYVMPFDTLYTSFGANSPMGAEFARAMRAISTTRLVDKPEMAQARLMILAELREKEILAFSSTGRPREYQLRLRVQYRLLDAQADEWIPVTEITLRREVTTTDAQLAAKVQEEVLLYRDMQTDMVQQLLRRLAAAPRR